MEVHWWSLDRNQTFKTLSSKTHHRVAPHDSWQQGLLSSSFDRVIHKRSSSCCIKCRVVIFLAVEVAKGHSVAPPSKCHLVTQ